MRDIIEHTERLSEGSAPDEAEDIASANHGLADGYGNPLLREIEHRLLTLEMDAYDRFNAAMDALGDAAANPFASRHCEVHRIEAHAFRKARVAIMGEFGGDAP